MRLKKRVTRANKENQILKKNNIFLSLSECNMDDVNSILILGVDKTCINPITYKGDIVKVPLLLAT